MSGARGLIRYVDEDQCCDPTHLPCNMVYRYGILSTYLPSAKQASDSEGMFSNFGNLTASSTALHSSLKMIPLKPSHGYQPIVDIQYHLKKITVGHRRHRDVIAREGRLCRFCKCEVEDEPHAILYCTQRPKTLQEKTSALIKSAPRLQFRLRQASGLSNIKRELSAQR